MPSASPGLSCHYAAVSWDSIVLYVLIINTGLTLFKPTVLLEHFTRTEGVKSVQWVLIRMRKSNYHVKDVHHIKERTRLVPSNVKVRKRFYGLLQIEPPKTHMNRFSDCLMITMKHYRNIKHVFQRTSLKHWLLLFS